MRTAMPIGLGGSQKIILTPDTAFISTARPGSEASDRIHTESLTGAFQVARFIG